MKKYIHSIFCFARQNISLNIFLALLFYNSSFAQTWQPVGPSEFDQPSYDVAVWPSMAIDKIGTPYIVYYDQDNNGKAIVRKYNGSEWVTVGTSGFSASGIDYPNIAIDNNDTPYVVYGDKVNGGKATVMKFDGTSWVTVGRAGFSSGSVSSKPSIIIDKNGVPYAAYNGTVYKDSSGVWVIMDNANFSSQQDIKMAFDTTGTLYVALLSNGTDSVKVMKDSSGTWVSLGNQGFFANNAGYISFVLDKGGTPYVAYSDFGNSYKATVMKDSVGTWVTVGKAGFTAGQAHYVSLKMDKMGTLYIAYEDAAYNAKATVMKDSSGTWVTVGKAGFSSSQADYISISMDNNGNPYVVFSEWDYANVGDNAKARVMKDSDDIWVPVGSTYGLSRGWANYTSLTIDSAGVPFVIYEDEFNLNKATVKKFDGSNWVTVGIRGFSAGKVAFTSIAVDKNSMPYVAYMDSVNGNKATVMKYNGSSWVTVDSAGFSAGVANYTSIAINDSGTPYVIYQDGGNGNKATVMQYNGKNWVTVGKEGFSAGVVNYPSIAIDKMGTPYVTYEDGGNGDRVTVMKYNGSSWVTVGSAGFSTGIGYHTSIAIDSLGIPYVDFEDKVNNHKCTVMKYNGSSWVTVGNAGFSLGKVDYTSLAIDKKNGVPYVVSIDSTDSYSHRATVWKYNGSSWVSMGISGFSGSDARYPSLAIDGSGRVYVVLSNNGVWAYKFIPPTCAAPTTPTLSATATSLCNGKSDTLSIATGSLDSATAWHWYSGSCGGTAINIGTTISVAPTITTTYYARGEGGCITPGSCGSITINVTDTSTSSVNATICSNSSYTFNGNTYTMSGMYNVKLANSAGCDSIVSLNLTVNPIISKTVMHSMCDGSSFPFNGKKLITQGTYYDTLSTSFGCDSIIALNLTVNKSSIYSASYSICSGSSIFFNGKKYSLSGTYTDTTSNYLGCDSVVILHLAVNYPSATGISASICASKSYVFNGKTISATGTYYDTLTNKNGCDSIVTLNLTVLNVLNQNINDTINKGDSITIHNKVYKKGGTYTDTLYYALSACDSLVTHISITIDSTCIALFTIDSTDTVTHQVYVTNRSTGQLLHKWYFGDGDTSSSNVFMHSYTVGGTYYLCLKIVCAAGDTASYCHNINGDSSRIRGLHPFALHGRQLITTVQDASLYPRIRIYPNPFNSYLVVNLEQSTEEATIIVEDILGQQMLTKIVMNEVTLLDLSAVNAGIYIIQVQTPTGRYTAKVVKD